MPLLSLHNLSKHYGATPAVDDVSLVVERGEFFGLLGPSGCGKTTLLRLISGLETPDAGRVLLDGKEITNIPAQRRSFGIVFQSYALFPHLNVFENVAFGLRARRVAIVEVRERVRRALNLVRLSGYERRRPAELSGGEQQRVAIARAIVIEPCLLLCDEPLSNLDVRLRHELRDELREIAVSLTLTVLYVTHDQEEAFALCDRIGIMERGRVLQIDEPRTLYEHPRHRFVQQFLGHSNLIEAVRTETKAEACLQFVTVAGGHTLCTLKADSQMTAQRKVTLTIRPEHLRILNATSVQAGGGNVLRARIVAVRFGGATVTIRVCADGLMLEALQLSSSQNNVEPRVGEFCFVELPRELIKVLI